MRLCTTVGCGKPHLAKGLCQSCYQKQPHIRERANRWARKKLQEPGERERRQENQRRFYRNHPGRMKLKNKNYFSRNKERILKQKAEYTKAHPEQRKATLRRHLETHRWQYVAKSALKRARLAKATPPWLTKEDFKEIREIYKTCPESHHVDHIVPLAGATVCGLHVPWNLRHLPGVENLKKGNKILNQCDGCCSGWPIIDGNHVPPGETSTQAFWNGKIIGCTKHLYEEQVTCSDSESPAGSSSSSSASATGERT